MSTVRRISLSVPIRLAEDLDYVHKRIGVSKSALVSEMLGGGLSDIRGLLEDLPDSPTPDDVVRFRGASVEKAHARVSSLRDLVGAS